MDSRYIKVKDPDGLRALKNLRDSPKSVSMLFHELLSLMDKTNALYAKHEDLADLCGIGVTTLKKAISDLSARQYIQVRRSSNGCFYSINASIATKCSRKVEMYSAGYELWTCKVLVNKKDSPVEFNEPLEIKE